MRQTWEGDWYAAPGFRVRVRIVPVLLVRYDLHLQLPAGGGQHPGAGVDVVIPRVTWSEALEHLASYGMTDDWSPAPPPASDTERQRVVPIRVAPRSACDAAALVAAAPLAVAV